MDNVKKVSEEIYAAGQPTAEDLQEYARSGLKSVVNLRSPDEADFLSDEQQQAETVGLNYVHVPLNSTKANDQLTAKVLEEIEGLPTPIVLHCGAGARAGALALIALATKYKLNQEQVLKKAEELGININQPHLKQFLENKE
ncbi:phosphatase [Scytonema sp. UIC 10036]|uniref:beta-lactamase hydrolase domain-containing protein n=1 Tax=Scytonema sp. UIC 10036 TaxID=2304196 RepID=UPI0012DA289C|nr:sulfur transferase domain-containing protein [Scytonema sp. UIC 10036]MUG93499.1 phosphatase [Scytonema sp. UIC 10036]